MLFNDVTVIALAQESSITVICMVTLWANGFQIYEGGFSWFESLSSCQMAQPWCGGAVGEGCEGWTQNQRDCASFRGTLGGACHRNWSSLSYQNKQTTCDLGGLCQTEQARAHHSSWVSPPMLLPSPNSAIPMCSYIVCDCLCCPLSTKETIFKRSNGLQSQHYGLSSPLHFLIRIILGS